MKIKINRLILGPFQDADRSINAQIFADPEVRRFALGTLDREAANARLDRAIAAYDERGFGMLALPLTFMTAGRQGGRGVYRGIRR